MFVLKIGKHSLSGKNKTPYYGIYFPKELNNLFESGYEYALLVPLAEKYTFKLVLFKDKEDASKYICEKIGKEGNGNGKEEKNTW